MPHNDFRGAELARGDLIVYPHVRGDHSEMMLAEVLKIIDYRPTSDQWVDPDMLDERGMTWSLQVRPIRGSRGAVTRATKVMLHNVHNVVKVPHVAADEG